MHVRTVEEVYLAGRYNRPTKTQGRCLPFLRQLKKCVPVSVSVNHELRAKDLVTSVQCACCPLDPVL